MVTWQTKKTANMEKDYDESLTISYVIQFETVWNIR